MNKKHLAEEIAKKLSLKKYEAYNFIDLLIEVATENFKGGQKIVLSKFGTLLVKNKKTKRVINPSNRQPMLIQPAKTIKFIPSENLKRKFEGNG